MQRSDRPYDLVLFGATGFVGALTARYLAEQQPPGLRVALAGRSRQRLAAVRDRLGEAAASWSLELADAADADRLGALAARAAVVVTTVGPYARYGLPLTRACAAAGTHYADLTGEVLFVRRVIDECEAPARASGAKIVTSCGFDSIPSDLGVLALAQRAEADGAGTLEETTLRVRSLRGGLSGGTIASARGQAIEARGSATARRLIADPYALSPDRAAEPPARAAAGRRGGLPAPLDRARRMSGIGRSDDGAWTGPFVMASHNTRIVRRSNALLDYRYGRDFRYREVTDCGPGPAGLAKAGALAGVLTAVVVGMSFGPTRALLDRALPAPGQGPTEAQQAAGRFVFDIETVTTGGARYVARVAADRDPGYSGTAVMLGETGLSLALDDLLPGGGVLTPASALGAPLMERLRAQGFTIDVRAR